MAIKFITGNKNKFEEIKSIVNPIEIEQLEIDLPEIQEIDPYAVVKAKLQEAMRQVKGECLVEDQGLFLDCLGGKLPGPFIKWFEKGIGNKGIVNLAKKMENNRASAYTLLGYASKDGEINFFEGSLAGFIVESRGDKDFGWGPIFMPDGHEKTFGEMDREEKHAISMRGLAARKLKEYLENQSL